MSLFFNQSTITPGPFEARLRVKNLRTGDQYKWEDLHFQAVNRLGVRIPQLDKPTAYEVRCTFSEVLAYAGKFSPKALAF